MDFPVGTLNNKQLVHQTQVFEIGIMNTRMIRICVYYIFVGWGITTYHQISKKHIGGYHMSLSRPSRQRLFTLGIERRVP